MLQSIVSSQGQTTVPAKIRKILNIEPGNLLKWQIDDDKLGIKRITVTAGSIKNLSALKGVAKDLYKPYGGGKKYLERERKSWI